MSNKQWIVLIIQPLPAFLNSFPLHAPLSAVSRNPSFVQSAGQHHGKNNDIENWPDWRRTGNQWYCLGTQRKYEGNSCHLQVTQNGKNVPKVKSSLFGSFPSQLTITKCLDSLSTFWLPLTSLAKRWQEGQEPLWKTSIPGL